MPKAASGAERAGVQPMTRKLQDPIARLEAGDCCVKGLFNESRRLSVHIESGSKRRAQAGVLAVLVAIALVGCDKGVQGNPNAPGTPGAANAREVVAPAVAATPGRGPNWVAGSQIHPVSSAQEAVPRATGKGMSASSGMWNCSSRSARRMRPRWHLWGAVCSRIFARRAYHVGTHFGHKTVSARL